MLGQIERRAFGDMARREHVVVLKRTP